MSDRDGLRQRADVLQRVADQLSAQLRVERWSNRELRKLLGEPLAPRGMDNDRLAARRFLTFASVAVATAAAVALLVSRPWRGADFVGASAPAISAAATGTALGGTIVPFTIVGEESLLKYVPERPRSAAAELAVDASVIFSRPATPVRLTPGAPRHPRPTLEVGIEDIFGPRGRERGDHVP
jgi:hypothetical protein